jgi:hypothetical protein
VALSKPIAEEAADKEEAAAGGGLPFRWGKQQQMDCFFKIII